MPSTKLAIMVSSRVRNRLPAPRSTISDDSFSAIPVSVMTPISIPAIATAATTGSTLRTVSIIAAIKATGPIRVCGVSTDTTSVASTHRTAAADGVYPTAKKTTSATSGSSRCPRLNSTSRSSGTSSPSARPRSYLPASSRTATSSAKT